MKHDLKHWKSERSEKFDDDYTGPVLLEGSSVADFMSSVLFIGRERLLYDNNIPSLTGFRNDTRNSMESKIGKNVAATSLTVKAGQRVSKGQILGRVDVAGMSQQLASIENQYNLAKTTFERQKNLWAKF